MSSKAHITHSEVNDMPHLCITLLVLLHILIHSTNILLTVLGYIQEGEIQLTKSMPNEQPIKQILKRKMVTLNELIFSWEETETKYNI